MQRRCVDAQPHPHGPLAVPGCLGAAEVAALQAAVDAVVTRAGDRSRILVARAAEALDDLRDELAQADYLIAEQQDRIGKLYEVFAGRQGDGE